MRVWACLWGALALAAAGCGGDDGGDEPSGAPDAGAPISDASGGDGGPGPGGGPTFHGDLRPIIEAKCSGCHSEGGIGPFALGYDEAEWVTGPPWWASVANMAVQSGQMPPWPAEDGCRDVVGKRSLSEETKALFQAWADGGFPEGDLASYEAPEEAPSEVPTPDILTDAGADFAPHTLEPDDFQCLIMAHEFTERTFVRGIQVFPDETSIVHHALVYAVAPSDVPQLEALDQADPETGYQCFGGPMTNSRQLIMVWIPGTDPILFDEGAAFPMEPGTKLVMQVHYNVLFVGEGEEPPGDRSQVGLWTMPAGETPTEQVVFALGANTDIVIPPGDPASFHTKSLPVGGNATIIGAVPHMHFLGTKISARIEHADGAESCLVDIDEWDYNWQQTYLFPPEARVTVKAQDRHVVECEFDNSAANQPTIGGEKGEPQTVTWGDGTLDEMCLNFLIATIPYAPEPPPVVGGSCGEFEICVDGCAPDDTTCFTSCFVAGGAGCANCDLLAYRDCGLRLCAAEMQSVLSCLEGCQDGVLECLLGSCEAQSAASDACMRGHIQGGACDAEFEGCGVTFGE